MTNKQRPDGWWYPWIFVGAFAVVFAVNGTMAFFAVDSWTGLVTKHAFKEGSEYNSVLAQVSEQQAMGWSESFSYTPATHVGPHGTTFTLHFTDRTGAAIDGLTINAQATRPTHEGYDQTFVFTPQGNGMYSADVDLPLPGNWELRYIATRADELYKMSQRVNVR